MQTAVKQWGNSLCVRLNKKITSKLNINSGTVLDVEIQSNNAIILKHPYNRLKYLLSKVNKNNLHNEVFASDDTNGFEEW